MTAATACAARPWTCWRFLRETAQNSGVYGRHPCVLGDRGRGLCVGRHLRHVQSYWRAVDRMMQWLNPARWLLIIAAIAAAGLGLWRLDASRQQIGYDRAQAEYTAAALKASEAARQREQDLQTQADKARKVKDAEIARIGRSLDAALDSLRHRPERPAELPSPASAGAGCSGAQLYRADAEFLARESARADELRAALNR